MLPLAVRGATAVAATPMARSVILPAARAVSGVARDVTAKVSRKQLAKGVTIGSLATMGVDAVVDFFMDNADETTASIKSTLTEHGHELTEEQADALLDVVNGLNEVTRRSAAEYAHDDAIDPSEHMVYGLPQPMFELPTDGDSDRKRAEQLYNVLRQALSFEQIEAIVMLARLAGAGNLDAYLDHLEGAFRVSRAA